MLHFSLSTFRFLFVSIYWICHLLSELPFLGHYGCKMLTIVWLNCDWTVTLDKRRHCNVLSSDVPNGRTLSYFTSAWRHFISPACADCSSALRRNIFHPLFEARVRAPWMLLGRWLFLILSDPPLLRSTESSKPQSPSKRLSVSRGIKQLFQSATKFVRLLQR